ncbi:hypothetical protein D3C81_2094090 [compost metagenome]
MQGAVKALEGIQNHQAMFFVGHFAFGYMGQAFLVGALQGATAELVDHQAASDAAQVSPRFFDRRNLACTQQAHEGVLRKVCSVFLAADPAAQPAT